MELFYDFKTFELDKKTQKWKTKFNPEDYKRPIKIKDDLINFSDGKKFLKKGSKLNRIIARKIFDEGLKQILVTSEYFLGKYVKNTL